MCKFYKSKPQKGKEAVTSGAVHTPGVHSCVSALFPVRRSWGSLDLSGGSQVLGSAKSQGVTRTSFRSRRQETDGSETRHWLEERAIDKDEIVEHPKR